MLDPATVLSRRILLEEPVSRAASLSRALAGFAVLTLLIGVAVARRETAGALDGLAAAGAAGAAPAAGATPIPVLVFAALGVGLFVALAAVVSALLAFRSIWRTGRRGFGLALTGLLVGLALLAAPGFYVARALSLPEANDATTDIIDPPEFSMSAAALAARGGRAPPEAPEATRAAQRAAHPALTTLTLDVAPGEAHRLARRAVGRMGWTVVESLPPSRQTGIGRIEAFDRTRVLRFVDDVTLRVRPAPDGGSRLDVRSASRLGRHDLGANAARILAFLDRVSELAREDGVQVRR